MVFVSCLYQMSVNPAVALWPVLDASCALLGALRLSSSLVHPFVAGTAAGSTRTPSASHIFATFPVPYAVRDHAP